MSFIERLKYDEGQLDPDSYGPGIFAGDYVPITDFQEFAAIATVGVLGVGCVLEVKLQQAQSALGLGGKDIPGKSVIRSEANGDGDEVVSVAARAGDLDEGYTHARVFIQTDNAAGEVGAIFVRAEPGRRPQINA